VKSRNNASRWKVLAGACIARSVSLRNRDHCGARRICGYYYKNSTAVQHLECVAFIVLHRSTELRNRAGAKEEQIRM